MLSATPLKYQPDILCKQIALFVEHHATCDSGMVVFFARSHRMTRTEEQVLNLLCRRLGTLDIALTLDVAVSTVRSHVRSLCIRTGAKGARVGQPHCHAAASWCYPSLRNALMRPHIPKIVNLVIRFNKIITNK